MTTFSSSSEFTESFDASCQLAQAPVTFPHLMEEQCGDVWREQPAGVSEAQRQRLLPARVENVRRHVAIGKCYPSTTSLTFPWLQFLSRSLIDPDVRIPGLSRISLICWRLSARWLRQVKAERVLEKGAQSRPTTSSSSSSSPTAVQTPSATAITCSMPSYKNPPQTILFTISVASQRHQMAIQSYLYVQGEANTAVK